ncbi:MAG: response regulator [gamma proteobacterium symbiont of Phacoides pectinatus]
MSSRMNSRINSGYLHGYSRQPRVCVVNQDPVVNSVVARSLADILIECHAYRSPMELLHETPANIACFLLDFTLPEIGGLELMERLRRNDCFQPCVFMSARLEPELVMLAMNRGAFGFVKRPFQTTLLADMMQRAINHAHAVMPHISQALEYRSGLATLSRREHQVLELLERGQSARGAAHLLGLSPRTVENHRARIFAKLNLSGLGQLIERATALRLLRATGAIR